MEVAPGHGVENIRVGKIGVEKDEQEYCENSSQNE
jgi:hypothetical protein